MTMISLHKNRNRTISIAFIIIHYILSFSIFLISIAQAMNIDQTHPLLGATAERVIWTSYYVLLFPFGHVPFGIFFNSLILGVILYAILNRKNN